MNYLCYTYAMGIHMQNFGKRCQTCHSTENLMISGHRKTTTYYKCRKCNNKTSRKYYRGKPKLVDFGKHCRYCDSPDNLVIYFVTKSGGQVWICSECNTNKAKESRYRNGHISSRRAAKKWSIKNNEKTRAHGLLRYYTKGYIGTKIIRPDICSSCGKKVKVDGHHPDYSKPLEVIWLCKKCHKKEHAKTKII